MENCSACGANRFDEIAHNPISESESVPVQFLSGAWSIALSEYCIRPITLPVCRNRVVRLDRRLQKEQPSASVKKLAAGHMPGFAPYRSTN